MNVIVLGEHSARVRTAFKLRGHNAASCDLLPTDIPGTHYQIDMRQIDFTNIDLVIAHPDCTFLSSSGARWWNGREEQQGIALGLFNWILDLPVEKIAVENPIGIASTLIRKPDQIIQPWQFGHPETKATCLWLKGLPLLRPTLIVKGRHPSIWLEPPSNSRKMKRSLTYLGIASAMAAQWG